MRVRRNTPSGDWSMGRHSADYSKEDEAIQQNVITRIKSFQNDWFLDTQANIDWFNLLGRKGTQDEIKAEIERVIIATNGVIKINDLQLTKNNRSASISLSITTIFNSQLSLELGIEQ